MFSESQNKSVFKVLVILAVISIQSIESVRRFGLRNKIASENQSPFVLLYEHESFRGKEYVQFFGRECVSLPEQYANWTSSIDTHRSCVSVCQDMACDGPCHKVFSNQGLSKLRLVGFNDNIQSLRSCYQF